MSNIWIDPTNGDDANNGTTKALAVKTFSDANGLLSSGDTLKIVDGTHDVSAQTGSLTFSQDNITIESENLNYSSCVIDFVETCLEMSFNGGLIVRGIHFHRWIGDGGNYSGLFKVGGSSTNYFQNCIFSDYKFNSSYQGVIYTASGCTQYITGCNIINTNTMNFSYVNGLVGGGLTVATGTLYFYNNTVCIPGTGTKTTLFGFRSPTDWTVDIKNMIFDTNSDFELYDLGDDWSSFDVNISYCCLYDNGGTGSINTQAFTVGSGMIYTDPKLVDPTEYNFNLEPDSPCWDAGSI